jgi:arylsulfatase A-like enzyme
MNKRPNILFIATDQQRWDHLGIETPFLRTPTLNRLANEGVHFSRAYTPSPLCTPCRVSWLTGRYPSSHGAYSIGVNAAPFPGPTIPGLLGKAGYHTALIGKTHFVPRKDEAAHFAGCATPSPEFFHSSFGPYLGFDHVETSRGHTTDAVPDMHYRAWLEEKGADYREWFPQMTDSHEPKRTGAWNIPPELHDSTWVAERSAKWILDQPKDSPWCCWMQFQDPHNPIVCPEPWFTRAAELPLVPFPGARPGEFDNKPAFYRKAFNGDWSHFDDGHGVPCAYAVPELDANAKTALQATYGMIEFLDDRIGWTLAQLEKSGQLENTIVVFTSDHGEYHGHHGFWYKGLPAYEDAQRVPLIVWGGGVLPHHSDAVVNTLDTAATFLAMAGVSQPPFMQGRDLGPILMGEQQHFEPDHTFVENMATSRVYQLTLVTRTHKLVVYRDSADGELYDLASDPDQFRNLWNEAQFADLRSELILEMIREQLRSQGSRQIRTAFA